MTGEPSYIELGVPDADAARAFYGGLLGWQPSGTSGPGAVTTSTLDIGIHDNDPEPGMLIFLEVDDLGGALTRVADLGGRVLGPVIDGGGFGNYAICADDQGVRFALRQQS